MQRRLDSVKNPSCPPALSAHLADDVVVGMAAAWNPNCDVGTHWRLATDDDAEKRAEVAEHTTHASVLAHLAEDDHAMVRYCAAQNPGCGREMMRHIFENPEVDTDTEVWAYRPDSTVEELQDVAERAADWWVFAAVGAPSGLRNRSA